MSHQQNFLMINVGNKPVTHRKALACGQMTMSDEAMHAVLSKTVPKGDVFSISEIAGMTSAKQTSSLLPLCHPLALDSVQVWHETDAEKNSIQVFCEVHTHAKTGVEMEALCGAMGALLCMHDLLKMIDPALVISNVYLAKKEGGKSGLWQHPCQTPQPKQGTQSSLSYSALRCGVVTISDRAASKVYTDESGMRLVALLKEHGTTVEDYVVVPDDKTHICEAVLTMIRRNKCDIVMTTGGTGLGTRDVTPEALIPYFSKEVLGVGELLRRTGSQKTSNSWLSRSTAGVIDSSLVILLPGSPKAVTEGFEAIVNIVPHAIKMIRNESH